MSMSAHLRFKRNQLGSASNLEHLLILFPQLKTKKTLIPCHLSKSQCPLPVQLAPILVPVFPEPFSSSLASLAALSTFTSLNLTHFGAFLLLLITVAHDQSLHLICAQFPNSTCIYLICAPFLHCTLLYTVLYNPKLCSIFPNWM